MAPSAAYDHFYECEAGKKNTTFTCQRCKHKFTGSLQKARCHILCIKSTAAAVAPCTAHYTAEEKQPLQELEDAAQATAAKRQRTQQDEQQDPLWQEAEEAEPQDRAGMAALSGGR